MPAVAAAHLLCAGAASDGNGDRSERRERALLTFLPLLERRYGVSCRLPLAQTLPARLLSRRQYLTKAKHSRSSRPHTVALSLLVYRHRPASGEIRSVARLGCATLRHPSRCRWLFERQREEPAAPNDREGMQSDAASTDSLLDPTLVFVCVLVIVPSAIEGSLCLASARRRPRAFAAENALASRSLPVGVSRSLRHADDTDRPQG